MGCKGSRHPRRNQCKPGRHNPNHTAKHRSQTRSRRTRSGSRRRTKPDDLRGIVAATEVVPAIAFIEMATVVMAARLGIRVASAVTIEVTLRVTLVVAAHLSLSVAVITTVAMTGMLSKGGGTEEQAKNCRENKA